MPVQREPDFLLVKLGKAVRELREELGISQEKLAARAELDRTYVGGIERGERNVSIKNLKKIADALEVKISDIFQKCGE